VRFASYDRGGSVSVGVLQGGAIRPLRRSLGDLVEIIEGGEAAMQAIRRHLRSPGETLPFETVHMRSPIERFRRDILCTGWNYPSHFEESKGRREGQDVERPSHPTFFTKGPDTVIGPYDDIAWDPAISTNWDYEAELALVIGKPGRSIRPADAMSHVFGFLLANDISQRDLQRRHGGQWLKGKSIDGTMPLGPVLVTADELDPADIQLSCHLNGRQVQDASTGSMAFDIPTLLAELSFGMTLRSGDVLLTGTPAGVGNARDPQLFLAEGDEVVVTGTGIGELRNRIVSRPLAEPWPLP
jgi:2-keto-4-pentenoate hydratase/2-oxohepta-3-ene-1,7-dioic acid hydratase in catechol pathway